MADNIVDIAVLAPMKFVKQGYANPLPYNTKYMEDWLYADTIPELYEKKPYLQPWQKNDIVPFQILSNYAPHQLELYDCEGNQVDTFVLTYKASSIEGTGQKVYEASIALNGYNEGVYQFRINSGDPVLETYLSEWFDLKVLHENTILLEYSHDENDHEIVFETGIVLRLRVHGELREFQPGADRIVFIDQRRRITQLSGESFETEKLIIGDSFGVPNYMIKKINDIYLCSQVLIDGKQYVGSEGARFEAKREELYPMTGWAFDVRPADTGTKKRFVADGAQGSPTTLVWLVNQKGFGPISGPASSNVIQIEEIK
jgi:hypothetical protein